ncbi:non-specific lipid-transfer protein 2-like [Nicotiana tomentosiformis]|uniref:non-specific lipid-transfer protein 2-like n=1 Tax=Nicotiana tomentosiformis TaxID=4098 RepID=UPI00051B8960|nr:non-specific lipid-transfer protein 2-like [Nicotiana tomentosiformis]
MKTSTFLAMFLVLTLVLQGEFQASEAVTCSASQLSECVGAVTSSQAPSSACCSKMREQQPCLCGYMKDPSLRQYVNSPNARRVANACGVAVPSC